MSQFREGYSGQLRATEEDDVEGHSGHLNSRAIEDDVEGHGGHSVGRAVEEDDVEGHGGRMRSPSSHGE
jgi:hypothetical protein